MSLAALVNTDEWPLFDSALTHRLHNDFVRDGVVVLPRFIREDVVMEMVGESLALSSLAFRSQTRKSPYLASPDESFPTGHPRRHVSPSSVEVVAYDLVPQTHAVRVLYESDELTIFIAAVLGKEKLFHYADPYGALNIAMMRDGDALGWHFDQTDFVVSLALQSSDAGGEFENAKQLRDARNENYDAVAEVLTGVATSRVRTEPMQPGTLMIFNGRTSMHRVTPVTGKTPRVVALLAYDTKPGTDSTDELKMSRYGRIPA
jgi:hypothetical protein